MTIQKDDAVSELIAAILLISLVTLAAAIIVVMLLSQPSVSHIPKVDAIVTNESHTVYLYHGGGDAIGQGQLKIFVDGEFVPMTSVQIRGGDNAWPWNLGKTLVVMYSGLEMPARVDLVYTGAGSETLLKTATLGQNSGSTTGPDSPEGPGTTPLSGNITLTFNDQDELDAWVVDQFREQLEGDSIYFTRAERGPQGVFEGTLQFRVTGGGSYLVIGNDPRTNLAVGDEVKLEFAPGKTPDLMFFMLGNKGWSIQAQGAGKDDLQIFIKHNGVWGPDISDNGDLTESWITDYDNYVSMLNFSVKGGEHHARLIINNATVLDGKNGDTFWFYRIEPAHPTLLMMQYAPTGAKGNGVYFVGKAERVTRNGKPIYP
ncbi:hypothetical protein DSECCO2_540870 [anaerobic digester metagenome]